MATDAGSTTGVGSVFETYDRAESPEGVMQQDPVAAIEKKRPPISATTQPVEKPVAMYSPCSTATALPTKADAHAVKQSDEVQLQSKKPIGSANVLAISLPSADSPTTIAGELAIPAFSRKNSLCLEILEKSSSSPAVSRKKSLNSVSMEALRKGSLSDMISTDLPTDFKFEDTAATETTEQNVPAVSNYERPMSMMCDLRVPASLAARAIFEALRGSFSKPLGKAPRGGSSLVKSEKLSEKKSEKSEKKSKKRSRVKLPRQPLIAKIGEREVRVKLRSIHVKHRKPKKHHKAEKSEKAEKSAKVEKLVPATAGKESRKRKKHLQQKQPKKQTQPKEQKEEVLDDDDAPTDPSMMTERQQIAYLLKMGEHGGEKPQKQQLPRVPKKAKKRSVVQPPPAEKQEQVEIVQQLSAPEPVKAPVKANETTTSKQVAEQDAPPPTAVTTPPAEAMTPPAEATTEIATPKAESDSIMDPPAIDLFCGSLQRSGVEEVEYEYNGFDSEDGLIAECIAEEAQDDIFFGDDDFATEGFGENEAAEPFPKSVVCSTSQMMACF
jgi:hypothetical protein